MWDMPAVTFQVLEGIDKGRTFRELPTPITIGREEGNVLRLNDERISRFHAKIQADSGEIILTDLDSTNGTRVNGNVVQIRRLRPGDRVGVGRSLLLFGTPEEIAARHAGLLTAGTPTHGIASAGDLPATINAKTVPSSFEHDDDFDLSLTDKINFANGTLFAGARPLPPLPLKMTPSQAARLAELLDFLHQRMTNATENIQANEDGTQVTLSFANWQRVLAVQMVLARYVRAVAEPDVFDE
jgi:predicted component of type VI protein secretion system